MRSNEQELRRRTWVVVILSLVVAACGSGEADPEVAEPNPAAEVSASSTIPDTTTTTVAADPTTTTDCTQGCPISDSDHAAIASVVAAYNNGEWDSFTALLATSEPSWATGIGDQTTEQIRADFMFSAAMNEEWRLGECQTASGNAVCEVRIEDDLHRALAPLGLEPSACSITVAVQGDLVDIKKYAVKTCHLDYDQAMHAYGAWFESWYPDLEPIQGFHYRGWNQADETAGARAAEYLEVYLDSGEAALEPEEHHHG